MTTLEQAWYMRVHQGLSYEEIGRQLFYSGESISRKLQNGFQRQSSARIYKKVHEFCMRCDGINCEKCKLMEFVQYALIKKQL
jgi:hypothetical protein